MNYTCFCAFRVFLGIFGAKKNTSLTAGGKIDILLCVSYNKSIVPYNYVPSTISASAFRFTRLLCDSSVLKLRTDDNTIIEIGGAKNGQRDEMRRVFSTVLN